MSEARWGRSAGVLVASALIALALALQVRLHETELGRWDRYTQPGFDARVYMAMADAPAVFTLPPWGFRLLAPSLVHAFGRPAEAATFLGVTLASLFCAGLLLYAYLRQLGHAPWASWLGVAAFGLSPPVAAAVGAPFLAEPVLIVVFLLLLLVVELRAGVGALAFVGALGALGKEVLLPFLLAAALPLAISRPGPRGRRAALLGTLGATLPALATLVVLHSLWVRPLPAEPAAGLTFGVFWLAVYRVLAHLSDWGPPALLLGVTPLALLGAARAVARPYLRRTLPLLTLVLGLPFAASVYTDDQLQVPFFADDIPRLLIYALPLLLHLALLALDRFVSEWRPAPFLAESPRWLSPLGAVLACALPLATWLSLDDYRRVDLRGPRDGRLVLALVRQSLEHARRLDAGRPVAYGVAERRFDPERSDPRHLERMRWFLRDGWGLRPHYGTGPALTEQRVATLLLPCLRPNDWTLSLRLGTPIPQPLELSLNGFALGSLDLGPHEQRYRVQVPAALLFRGDNQLQFRTAQPGLELIDLRIQPLGPPPLLIRSY